ncbi:MAG: serine/threonine protein kinase [Planctomycetes bacterium]|nr:serine/threonine protein kinase [Planctomycetota bacterium]
MPEPADSILDPLTQSGIISAEDALTVPPEMAEKTVDAVAQHLVDKQLITGFQARAFIEGRTANLVLDDYVIIDKLGEGGMGTVYKARHRRMDRLVALKVLSPATMDSPEAIKRFHREVQAAAKLTHPNIVAAYDAGDHDGVHFLVMELVDGENLNQVVRTHGPLPVRQALECVLEAARGFAHAHAKGIIHRDVKPSNLILMKPQESGTHVKILDMGLARFDTSLLTAAAPAGSAMTQAGVIMGTAEFMSPEQALDPKVADARSDVYSLGCTLYFLLTGEPIYQGDTLMIKIIAHRESPVPALQSRRRDVPAMVEALYQRMVAKTPESRIASMTEVIREVEACLGESAEPGPIVATLRARSPEPVPLLATLKDQSARQDAPSTDHRRVAKMDTALSIQTAPPESRRWTLGALVDVVLATSLGLVRWTITAAVRLGVWVVRFVRYLFRRGERETKEARRERERPE